MQRCCVYRLNHPYTLEFILSARILGKMKSTELGVGHSMQAPVPVFIGSVQSQSTPMVLMQQTERLMLPGDQVKTFSKIQSYSFLQAHFHRPPNGNAFSLVQEEPFL